MAEKADSEDSADLLLTVLKAHTNNIGSVLESAKAHYRGVCTVSRRIENHISLLLEPYYRFLPRRETRTDWLLSLSGAWTKHPNEQRLDAQGAWVGACQSPVVRARILLVEHVDACHFSH